MAMAGIWISILKTVWSRCPRVRALQEFERLYRSSDDFRNHHGHYAQQ
jgi:hypothetical protein